MNEFINSRFLLRSPKAIELYDRFASALPIVDCHCHLEPEQVASNWVAENIVELWIANDPYKWRAMRINGIEERFITGDAPAREKFRAFAETMPRLVGSPVFHWSALELKRYFGIDTLLNGDTADSIWSECNARIQSGECGAADLLRRTNVETVCTSDNWMTDLQPHCSTQDNSGSFVMLPSLRADAALRVEDSGYASWIQRLGSQANRSIDSLEALEAGLASILDAFDGANCSLSDHSFESVRWVSTSEANAGRAFEKALNGEPLGSDEADGLRCRILAFLAGEYARRDWTMQLHLGALRETSRALMGRVSIPGGVAAVGDSISSAALSTLFDNLERSGGLPRTIVYPLNIGDFEKVASLSGAFVEEGVWGKVQLGPPWWFNDHYDGIAHQLKVFSNYSALGRFVGMVTDTRSPLSMARFEYFRRVFCDLLGDWIDRGVVPNDDALLEQLVEDVCYRNAASIVNNKAKRSGKSKVA